MRRWRPRLGKRRMRSHMSRLAGHLGPTPALSRLSAFSHKVTRPPLLFCRSQAPRTCHLKGQKPSWHTAAAHLPLKPHLLSRAYGKGQRCHRSAHPMRESSQATHRWNDLGYVTSTLRLEALICTMGIRLVPTSQGYIVYCLVQGPVHSIWSINGSYYYHLCY